MLLSSCGPLLTKSIKSEMLSPRDTTASRACSLLRVADDAALLGTLAAELTRASDPDWTCARLFVTRWPVPVVLEVAVRFGGSYTCAGPVDLMKSAKSPVDSLSTLGSRGWGAFDRNLAPEFDAGRETGVNCFEGFADLGVSTGRAVVYLLTEDECERPVFGLGTSCSFIVAGGCTLRGESGD